MTGLHWTVDDLRIIGDIIMGSLLAGTFRLILFKAFFEPAAAFVGQYGYRRLDKTLGGRLPDLPDGVQSRIQALEERLAGTDKD